MNNEKVITVLAVAVLAGVFLLGFLVGGKYFSQSTQAPPIVTVKVFHDTTTFIKTVPILVPAKTETVKVPVYPYWADSSILKGLIPKVDVKAKILDTSVTTYGKFLGGIEFQSTDTVHVEYLPPPYDVFWNVSLAKGPFVIPHTDSLITLAPQVYTETSWKFVPYALGVGFVGGVLLTIFAHK